MIRASLEYAPFSARALALLIDSVLLIFANLVLQPFFDHPFFQALCGLIVSGSYYTLLTAGPWQATVGKRLMSLYVATDKNQPLTRPQALARFLAYTMPTLPLYSSLNPEAVPTLVMWLMVVWYSPALMTPQRTAVHDMLCRTRVYKGVKEKQA